jgi:hypothetical protein
MYLKAVEDILPAISRASAMQEACQSAMEIKLGSADCENRRWRDASAFATCENGY